MFQPSLPIDDALPALCAAMAERGVAVLQAPPGAGKTTRVPLALREVYPDGRILMLEPRRLAARGAAARMARTLEEPVGQQVGYRMRGDAKPGRRIEVITEGLLTRMLQTDPDLPGVACVIFDEFHERSLASDLGLALAWEVRQTLREDLGLLVMSATLDAAPVAAMLGDAPVITSQGRAFPVDIDYAQRPSKERIEHATAQAVRDALPDNTGTVLVFLPGERDIRATATALGQIPGVEIAPLYGALPFAAQQAALTPPAEGRKVVLATAIAETSLTIPEVRTVIDAGRARRSRFDPGSGMARLVTERVSQAEATQRAGRAGRVAPGRCIRLWTRGEHGALPAFAPPEIETTDLAGLALELAVWGSDADALALLTPPPAGPMAEARILLEGLGAIGSDGRITAHGRAMARLPLHPRLGHMLLTCGGGAADVAALLSTRMPVDTRACDARVQLAALRETGAFRREQGLPVRDGPLRDAKAERKRLTSLAPSNPVFHGDAIAASRAYPDRIAMRRPGAEARFLMSGGKGAALPDDDALAASPFLVVLDTDGHPREARIRSALPLTRAEIETHCADLITEQTTCTWSRRDNRVLARRQRVLGALILDDAPWQDAPTEAIARAMCDGIRQTGLTLPPAAARLADRIERARSGSGAGGADLPAADLGTLTDTLEDWLAPHLSGVSSLQGWKAFDPTAALAARLSWEQSQRLDQLVPAHFTTPLGRRVAIDYGSETPEISVRLQELFGQTTHPTVAGTPLLITLLSPAQRPVQTTRDLPGFWAGSYADVRKDMRARYPKHPWPKDPTKADPTLRAKPRKT